MLSPLVLDEPGIAAERRAEERCTPAGHAAPLIVPDATIRWSSRVRATRSGSSRSLQSN